MNKESGPKMTNYLKTRHVKKYYCFSFSASKHCLYLHLDTDVSIKCDKIYSFYLKNGIFSKLKRIVLLYAKQSNFEIINHEKLEESRWEVSWELPENCSGAVGKLFGSSQKIGQEQSENWSVAVGKLVGSSRKIGREQPKS